jgi:hypothetical protein
MEAPEYNDPDLKKLLATLAAAAVLLALGIAALSLPPAPRDGPARLLGACRARGPLAAGAAAVPLELPGPPVVAGFAKLRWAAAGQRDPVAVRALVAGEPGCAVGFVSAEILLVPGALTRAVEERTRDLGLAHLVVAATHTHAGPGGYWDSFLGGRLATGPYDPRVLSALADAAARALRLAAEARRPARLEAGEADASPLVLNRTSARSDGRLVSVRLSGADGSGIGELALLGAHATMLGSRNRLVSGDWPGALMRSRPQPLLFFQGALGDQTTHAPSPEAHGPEGYAAAVAARLDAVARSAPSAEPPLAVAVAAVPLPRAAPGLVPALLRRAAGRLFAGSVPAEARVAAIRLGPALLLAVPAEPVEEVGRAWRTAAGPGAEILSLAGDYLGYVETPARMARGEGETGRTYYGPELAGRLETALQVAVEAAAGR